jgi:hypothetical protein
VKAIHRVEACVVVWACGELAFGVGVPVGVFVVSILPIRDVYRDLIEI